MAATVQIQIATGSGTPTYANAETGAKWNTEDSLAGTTGTIAIPTATGTNYSWIKNLCLAVTATSTTTISNRRVAMASSPAAGLNIFFKSVAAASYAQASAGSSPASAGTNGATPVGYTLMTTSNQVYDSSSVATSSTGINGSLCVCCLGVDNTYTGGASSNAATPTLNYTYDEA